MEFQAIVLAGGKGTRMNDLVTKSMPKCFLPVGNKPMIYYPVKMLESAGFKEIIILTNESFKSRIKEELILKNGIQANLIIVGIDETKEENEDLGTAQALKYLKEKIVRDCMIVSCDLISSVNIQKMANFYRVNNAAFVMLLSDISDQYHIESSSLIGSKGKFVSEKDVIGFDPASNRLVYFGAKADVEDDESIKIKKSVLNKYSSLTWTTKLHDAHFYIIKKCLIDFILDNPAIFSLKGDFLPFITRKQFSSSHDHSNHQHNNSNEEESKKKSTRAKLHDYLAADDMTQLVNRSSASKSFHDLLGCFVFIQFDGFCYRANNPSIYIEANRSLTPKISQHFGFEPTTVYDKTAVSFDSLAGESLKLGDKVVVKRSVIGRNCSLGEKARVTNSILMDGVSIDESAILSGCIVCSNAKIGAKVELKDCLVSYGHEIASGKHSNETLKEVDNFIEVDC